MCQDLSLFWVLSFNLQAGFFFKHEVNHWFLLAGMGLICNHLYLMLYPKKSQEHALFHLRSIPFSSVVVMTVDTCTPCKYANLYINECFGK